MLCAKCKVVVYEKGRAYMPDEVIENISEKRAKQLEKSRSATIFEMPDPPVIPANETPPPGNPPPQTPPNDPPPGDNNQSKAPKQPKPPKPQTPPNDPPSDDSNNPPPNGEPK